MGPTASGKSKLAEALAEQFPVEIVSVDSALVYRGLNIGTAKPAKSVLQTVPYHLIDILDPVQAYSAAGFRRDALSVMDQIRARQRIPLLVGGTMLYFRTLEYGLSPLPESDPEVRKGLQQMLQTHSLAAMYKRLSEIDSATAQRLHPNDTQRILRALEVYESSGEPLSAITERDKGVLLESRLLKLVLYPADRIVLHQRIEARFEEMLKKGLVDEVAALKARGDLSLEKPSIRSVGYRQVWQYLDGVMDYQEMQQRAIYATRQLAKRQMTWLRTELNTEKIDMMNYDHKHVSNLIEQFLE